jgi:hypothetical protein
MSKSSHKENNLRRTSDYQDHFDAEYYLKEFYSDVDINANNASFLAFFIEKTVQILKDEQKHLESKKALEFDGRSTLSPSFLLAQYIDSIRFCDYAQCNINAVKNSKTTCFLIDCTFTITVQYRHSPHSIL